MRPISGRYRLAALLATVWCLVLLPVQTYVFAAPEVPGWVAPLESSLDGLVNQVTQPFPTLDPYYIFGRVFFPSYLLLAYGFVGVHLSQGVSASRLPSLLSKVLVGAAAIGGVADAVMYWGGEDPDLSALGGVQLGAWLVEEIALLVMSAVTTALGVAALRAKSMQRWRGILVTVAGVLALPAGFLTYTPHGVVLVVAIASTLAASTDSRAGTETTPLTRTAHSPSA